MSNICDQGLGKNAANFEQLTPLSFIKRAALYYPGHAAVVCSGQRGGLPRERSRTWQEMYQRCVQLASALSAVIKGIEALGFEMTQVFGPLAKTSTGKVQKYLLREKAERL